MCSHCPVSLSPLDPLEEAVADREASDTKGGPPSANVHNSPRRSQECVGMRLFLGTEKDTISFSLFLNQPTCHRGNLQELRALDDHGGQLLFSPCLSSSYLLIYSFTHCMVMSCLLGAK